MQADFCEQHQLFSRLWAQELVMSDLMNEQMKKWNIPSKTNMAIIDSGLEHKILPYVDQGFLRPIVILPYKLIFKEESVLEDRVSHGTSIFGLAEGRHGIGIYPTGRTTVYKMDMDGHYFSGDIKGATIKACEDGNEVIIHALGSYADQTHGDAFENRLSDELLRLNEKGCIIVKSAGNDGLRGTSQEFTPNPYDNFHRIAAIQPKDYLASFSSEGEVSAPGESVFSIKTVNYAAPICSGVKDNHFGQINGTSFSGPIYGEILQAVLDVLMVNHKTLNQKENIKRNALAVRIMRASRMRARFGEIGSVNGLIAVHIAKAWQDWDSYDLKAIEALSEEDLIATKNQSVQPKLCTKPFESEQHQVCLNKKNQCSARCELNTLRKYSVLCQQIDPLYKADLIELLLKKGDVVGAYRVGTPEVRSESKIIEALVKALEKRFTTKEHIKEFNRSVRFQLRPNQISEKYRDSIDEAQSMVSYLSKHLFNTSTYSNQAYNYNFTRLADEVIKIANIQTRLTSVLSFAISQLVDKHFTETVNPFENYTRDESLKKIFLSDALPEDLMISQTYWFDLIRHERFLFPKRHDHLFDESNALTRLTEEELRALRVALVKKGYFLFIGDNSYSFDSYLKSIIQNSVATGDHTFTEINELHQFEPLRYYNPRLSIEERDLEGVSKEDIGKLLNSFYRLSIFGRY